jgi:Ulp1 family protease
MGALALSITGYVIQDARNTARQDSELESTKARVQRLERIATTNTEARIRTEVQLGELRDGQNEIKTLIQAHDSASRKGSARKCGQFSVLSSQFLCSQYLVSSWASSWVKSSLFS